MKKCEDCEYCKKDFVLKKHELVQFCKSDKARRLFLEVTGEWPTCKALRNDKHYCGQQAIWFAKKKEK